VVFCKTGIQIEHVPQPACASPRKFRRLKRNSQKLRVAYTFVSMPVGGAEDFAATVSRYLPPSCDPVFVCLRELGVMGEEMQEAGREVHLVRVAPSKRWNIAGILRLARWFRDQRIGLVHSQTYNSHTYAIPAARLAGIGCLLHQQKTFERLRPHRMLMMRWLTRFSHRIVALSERTRRDMIRAFDLPENRTLVIPNVVDPAEFFRAKDRTALRRELKLDPDAFLIGSVASLSSVKNHPATLRVLRRLRDEGVAFSALLLGEGKERSLLESMRKDLELDRCVLMPGNKRPVAPWLQALDLVVHASRSEGQSLALLQAIACQIPIVASRIEGNVAILGDGHPGLFEPDSLEEYRVLLARCIREDSFRKELLASQDRLSQELPTAPRVAKKLGQLYEEIDP
jgi:L-malate glycosyltransferase